MSHGGADGLHEIILVVKDVRVSARFYETVVGLQSRGEPSDEWASFATISLEHPQWLGITRGPLLFEEHSPLPAGERFGPVHFALRAKDATPEAFLENADKFGVEVLGPQTWEGRMKGVSYYFYDPDNNLVEYWWPDESLRE
jgi:catechol 2,3-dioxygenase-like lactoylglutathione lyase family enzyme